LNFNLFNTLIFSGIIYGAVFIAVVSSNPIFRHKATPFLMFTIASLSLSNLQYWLMDVYNFEIPDLFYIQFELLIIPFFYIFLYRFFKDNDPKTLLVFFPFVLATLYQFWSIMEGTNKYHIYVEILTIFYNVILIAMLLQLVQGFRKRSKELKKRTRWIIQTIGLGILLILVWLFITLFFEVNGEASLKSYYPLWIGMSMLIYYMGSKFLIDLKVLNERKLIKQLKASPTSLKSDSSKSTYETFEKIENGILISKLYLNQNLTLIDVADKFGISRGYLSQLMGKYSANGFKDMINQLRVEEAKKMLENEEFAKYTNVSIGLEAGFNSKSSFFSEFKKRTGLTPNQYRVTQNNK